jgi:hypothetical protein
MFLTRMVVQRTEVGKFQTVTPQGSKELDPDTVLTDYNCHVIVQPNKLAIATVTSKAYPRRVAFEVMRDIIAKFEQARPGWAANVTPGVDKAIEFPYMIKICKDYEDPRHSDNILKIQNQLDETKDIMIQNIEQILQRGETIQELVDRTDDLEASSKVFFQNADKLNSCWGR